MILSKRTQIGLSLTLMLLYPLSAQTNDRPSSANNLLTLDNAISLAIKNDPWLQKSAFQENAAVARSVAMSSMPDPVVSIGLANLPTDGFAFNQEPMTQLKAGVTQMLPRGDTLKFQQRQQLEISQQQPFLRQDREASVAVTVAHFF